MVRPRPHREAALQARATFARLPARRRTRPLVTTLWSSTGRAGKRRSTPI